VDYGTDWTTYNTLSIRNRCNQELTIVGIVQRKNDSGYYYEDVSMKMPANYVRESKEELWTSVFTSVFGLDGDIRIYPKYDIEYAMLDKVQWIKIVGKNKPIVR
jgi:hypothetical protein